MTLSLLFLYFVNDFKFMCCISWFLKIKKFTFKNTILNTWEICKVFKYLKVLVKDVYIELYATYFLPK